MSNRSRMGIMLLTTLLVSLFSACLSPAATDAPAVVLNATLNEVIGSVDAKQAAETQYSPAENGLKLDSGAQVQTGDDGRARVDLSTGTFFRVGPSSNLTLESQHQ